jgi:hypothetical protein
LAESPADARRNFQAKNHFGLSVRTGPQPAKPTDTPCNRRSINLKSTLTEQETTMETEMFEFAISVGEGTLLAYGVTDMTDEADPLTEENLGNPAMTVILGRCAADCATGK